MTEKMGKRELLPETLLTSPIGSPESRAAARARLEGRDEDQSRPAYIIVNFVEGDRDENGKQIFAEPVRAVTQVEGIADREYLCVPNETSAAFIERVAATLPALSEFPPVIFLFPPETEEPSTAPAA